MRAPLICAVHGCPHIAVRMSRCEEHARERDAHQKRTVPTKVLERRAPERRMRAAIVRDWRRTHGDWCPGYRVPAHPARDLTAQHVDAVAEHGGGRIVVLCRACNSRHGQEVAMRLR